MRKAEAEARRERVIKLRESGLKCSQIEELLLMPEGSVKVLLHNIKKKNNLPNPPIKNNP